MVRYIYSLNGRRSYWVSVGHWRWHPQAVAEIRTEGGAPNKLGIRSKTDILLVFYPNLFIEFNWKNIRCACVFLRVSRYTNTKTYSVLFPEQKKICRRQNYVKRMVFPTIRFIIKWTSGQWSIFSLRPSSVSTAKQIIIVWRCGGCHAEFNRNRDRRLWVIHK